MRIWIDLINELDEAITPSEEVSEAMGWHDDAESEREMAANVDRRQGVERRQLADRRQGEARREKEKASVEKYHAMPKVSHDDPRSDEQKADDNKAVGDWMQRHDDERERLSDPVGKWMSRFDAARNKN